MISAIGAFAFFVLLLFAIGFHEFGHFVAARWAGVKVRQFFIGFGPTLWSIRRGRTERVLVDPAGRVVNGVNVDQLDDPSVVTAVDRPETEYGVKLLPLGGFVKIAGMSPVEEVPPEEFGRSFRAAPVLQRVVILAAGSFTHFVTAFVVLILLFSVLGIPTPTTQVQEVMTTLEDGRPTPAQGAGLRPGDTIVAIDGREVAGWDEVQRSIRSRPDRPLSLTVEGSDERRRTVQLTPVGVSQPTEDGGTQTIGLIGVMPGRAADRVNPIVGAGRSLRFMGEMFQQFVKLTPTAFTPEKLGLIPGRDPGDERPISIYGAGRVAAQAANEGVFMFLFLFVTINVFIGLFNLLPLPPLDGGHLLLLAIEKVRGKPVKERTLARVMAVGFTLLLTIGVALLYQDIVSPLDSPFQ